jgi:hypothetical protein
VSPSAKPRPRPARLAALGRCAAAGLAAATWIALAGPALASAAPGPAAGPFGLIPAPTAAGLPRPYFRLFIAPGRAADETVVVSNEGTRTERLLITVSRGVTAANSGSAYESIQGPCAGSTCWVSDLPGSVTLAPGVRRAMGFRVAVPAGTRPGQYLTGITAESAVRPRAVKVGSNGHASAKAIIIDQVTVGVAVTVGRPALLRTAVVAGPVTGTWVGSTPRLSIAVRNAGQTFARATGAVTCRQGGRARSYRVIMETVLPAGRALLAVNAPGLATGAIPCTLRLRDGAGGLIRWSGAVTLPPRTITRTYHPAKGVYVSLPQSTIPPWGVALLVLGALILVSLLAVLTLRHRRPVPAAGSRHTGPRSRLPGLRPRRPREEG